MRWRSCPRRSTGSSRLLIAVFLAIAACDAEPDELPPDESCKQAGYAIANRTFTCEGDGDLANARYERLMGEYRCLSNDGFACAKRTLELTCDQVSTAGDDLDQWLTLAACGLFEPKGTTSMEAGLND